MSGKAVHDPKTVGILGGGQLALLLCDAAKALNVTTNVFATNANDPALQAADWGVVGRFDAVEDLVRFFDRCDCVVFENEFIRAPVLLAAAKQSNTPLYPSAKTMCEAADKLAQKRLFRRLALPTADFLSIGSNEDPLFFLDAATEQFPRGFIIKWAKGGYDGGGVFTYRSPDDKDQAMEFVKAAQAVGSDVYAETLIVFEAEVALVALRKADDGFASYPLVQTIQEEHICTAVRGPAYASLQSKAELRAREVAEALNLVGVFAIEFFVKGGELFINELAPRVHNSGHATLDGCATSQFENHLRSVLQMELGPTTPKPLYGMINLLGPDTKEGPIAPPSITAAHTKVHWYQKASSRPGRKMGHVNLWCDVSDERAFNQTFKDCQAQIEEWAHKIGSTV